MTQFKIEIALTILIATIILTTIILPIVMYGL